MANYPPNPSNPYYPTPSHWTYTEPRQSFHDFYNNAHSNHGSCGMALEANGTDRILECCIKRFVFCTRCGYDGMAHGGRSNRRELKCLYGPGFFELRQGGLELEPGPTGRLLSFLMVIRAPT